MSTAARIIKITKADADQLAQLYKVEDQEAVVHFLQENPYLLPHLRKLPNLIQRYFLSAPLSLKLELDPEEPGLDHLSVGIAANLTVEEGLDRVDQFDEEWLPNTAPDVLMRLLVDVEPM